MGKRLKREPRLKGPIRLDQLKMRLGFKDSHVNDLFLRKLAQNVFKASLGADDGKLQRRIVGSMAYFHRSKYDGNENYIYLVFPGAYCSANLEEVWRLAHEVEAFCIANKVGPTFKTVHICADIYDLMPEQIIDLESFRRSKTGMRKSVYMDPKGEIETYVQKSETKEFRIYNKKKEILARERKGKELHRHDIEILQLTTRLARIEYEIKAKYALYLNDAFAQIKDVHEFAKAVLFHHLKFNPFYDRSRRLNFVWRFLKKGCKNKHQIFRTKTLKNNPDREKDLVRLSSMIRNKFAKYGFTAEEKLKWLLETNGFVGPTDVLVHDLFETIDPHKDMSETLNSLMLKVVQLKIENEELKSLAIKGKGKASKRAKLKRRLT